MIRQGDPYALLTRSRGIVELGGPEDATLVLEHTGIFAAAVWEKVAAFVEKERPARVFLTGGGGLIRPVADALEKSLKVKGVLLGVIDQGGIAAGSSEWRTWA